MPFSKTKWIPIGISILALALLGLMSFGPHNLSEKTSKPIIKIGAVLPLTGSQAFVGEGLREALVLAQNDLKKTQTKYDYQIIFEDCQFDAKTAASAAMKLVSVDKVDAIIDAYAPIGNAISPIAEANKVVHIGIAFDPNIAKGEYNFILFTTPETAARSFLGEMKKRGLRTLGIFEVNNPGILAVSDAVKSFSPEYGVSVVSDESFQSGERDFKGIIEESKGKKADIYALFALPPELEILAKQMDDLDVKNQTSIIYYEMTQNKALFEGQWFVGYAKPNDAFAQEYHAAYGGKDFVFGVPNIYDAFSTIVRAAESNPDAGKPSPTFIAKQMQNATDTEGVLGTLHVNPDGIIDTPVTVKTIKNGQFELEQ